MQSILVHLDASPRSAERLALAQQLAREQGGVVTAYYAVVPAMLSMPFLGASATGSVLALLENSDREQRSRARAVFDQAEAKGGVEMRWSELGNADITAGVFEQALYSDLLVLGQTDPEDRLTGALPTGFVASLVVDSGKPALVLPYVGHYPAIGRDVLLAWKPTREAARAVSASLPWLRRARRVVVTGALPPALERWLRVQGVSAELSAAGLADVPVGEALLSLAAELGADLLVMGCYGHSRARELVLGGATETLLRSMTLPVLMAH